MLKSYYVLISWASSVVIAQAIKPFIIKYRFGKPLDLKEAFNSGGFPSSHTSGVVSIATSVFIQDGATSSTFAIALAFCAIVMFDAANVRLQAGKNNKRVSDLLGELINQGIVDPRNFEINLKEVLGHTWSEVFSGLILGIIISIVLEVILKV